MSSVKWVDLCASDSEIEGSSDDQPSNNKAEIKDLSDAPSLQKALSSPEQSSKSIKYDNQAKIAQNIQKLANYRGSKLWLYIPNDHLNNRQRQIEEILYNNKQFQNFMSNGKGWNVLIDTQLARKYLQKGYYQKGINLRFIYSNKNENKDISGRRLEKKFSEKYPDNRNSEARQQMRNTKLKSKQTFNQKSSYQRDRDQERFEKKKVKYVAKETFHKKQDQQKPKLEEIKEEKKGSQQLQKLPSSYKQEKIGSQISINNQKSNEQKNQKLQIAQNQKQMQKQKKEEKQEEQNNSEKQQADRRKKQKQREKQKQKNRKKKVKSKGSSGFHDPNNPFSSFA